MSAMLWVLPSICIAVAVLVATAPLGLGPVADLVLHILPYMVAHVFVARGKGFVPSPVVFVAGLLVDLADGGPLGYWALIYMLGLLITRQMSGGLGQTVLGRLSGVVFIVFALAAGQVVVASLFQLKWIDWHVVLAATAIAGLIGAVFDLAWPTRSSDKASNMMIRGGG